MSRRWRATVGTKLFVQASERKAEAAGVSYGCLTQWEPAGEGGRKWGGWGDKIWLGLVCIPADEMQEQDAKSMKYPSEEDRFDGTE